MEEISLLIRLNRKCNSRNCLIKVGKRFGIYLECVRQKIYFPSRSVLYIDTIFQICIGIHLKVFLL